jgi:cobalt-zinc-cadmium efflux system outer membrane protein
MKNSLAALLILGHAGLVRATEEPAGNAATNVARLNSAYISQLAEEVRTNHPALRAVDARARAADFGTNAVRTWEDPMFMFGGSLSSARGFDPAEEGDLIYGLEQRLPLFGKAAAARRAARAEAETERARVTWQFQTLRRDLAKALFRAAYAGQVVAIGTQDLAWMDTMVSTMEERYRAGTATQVEILRLQNERDKRIEQLRTDARRRDYELVAVNRLLGRSLEDPLPRFELPPPAEPIQYTQRLAELAVRFEPKLKMMEREIDMARATVATTRKSRLPDVSALIDGRQYSGDGGFREGTFAVKLTLPWFNGGKYRSDLARDRSRVETAELEALDYQFGVRQEVHQLVINIDAARREALLFRDQILPRTAQALESAHANWLAGQGASFDVMEARRMLLEARTQYARAVSEQYQSMAELVLCCGLGDFEALEAVMGDLAPNP